MIEMCERDIAIFIVLKIDAIINVNVGFLPECSQLKDWFTFLIDYIDCFYLNSIKGELFRLIWR